MIQKPIILESDIWANGYDYTSEHIINPDNTKKETGWIYGEKPPYNIVNWQHKIINESIVHINQNGMPLWDAETTYNSGARTIYNGDVYVSNDINVNEQPDISTYWDLNESLTSLNTITAATGVDDADKFIKTNPSGKMDISLLPISAMTYKGNIDITGPAPVDPAQGDFYTAVASGTIDFSWTGVGGTEAFISQAFVWGGDQWNAMGASVDIMEQYLRRDGTDGGMTSDLLLANSTPSNNLHATSKLYVDTTISNFFQQETDFTATQGQTTFSVTYTVGNINVFIDGIKLRNTEYTATTGTSVVLNDGVDADTWVNIVH